MTSEEYDFKTKDLFDRYNIPLEFIGALNLLAYEQGHAYGLDEVYGILVDYVCVLSEPIKNYTKRILTN
jgi:hypothetical protein